MTPEVLTEKPFRSVSPAIPGLRSAGIVIASTVAIAVSAHLSVPLFFTPVPLTLQDFTVLLIGLLMSPVAAFATLALYLLEGAAGLPVFAPQGPAGVLHLLGPTGGYLISYIVAAPLISWLRRRGTPTFLRSSWSAAAGSAAILTTGASWLWALTHLGMQALMMHAVLPFLPGTALKIVAAAAIATGVQGLRARNHDRASAN